MPRSLGKHDVVEHGDQGLIGPKSGTRVEPITGSEWGEIGCQPPFPPLSMRVEEGYSHERPQRVKPLSICAVVVFATSLAASQPSPRSCLPLLVRLEPAQCYIK